MKEQTKLLEVKYKGSLVGKLALTATDKVAFQYDSDWIKNGFSISPFSLPLDNKVFVPVNYNYDGLFGVFADSLPDSWGRLLLDRMLLSKGIDVQQLTVLDRLSIVGTSGMGALEYYPEYKIETNKSQLSLDELAEECNKIFQSISNTEYTGADIDSLFAQGGSSGGARPKAFIKYNNEDWIVKFPYSKDIYNTGKLEYEYSIKATACGIDMSETKLFPSKTCSGYFGTKRFDRPKIHMISAAALLEVDFERSLADYADLFKLISILTAANKHDIEQMYLRMCFNVIMKNQDDHLKNFAFLYDDQNSIWRLSPAYDLTRAESGYGQHTTTINGKGINISNNDLIAIGQKAGITKKKCTELLDKVVSNA